MLTDFDIKIRSELALFVPPNFNLHPRGVVRDSIPQFKAGKEQPTVLKDIFAAAGIQFNVQYSTQGSTGS